MLKKDHGPGSLFAKWEQKQRLPAAIAARSLKFLVKDLKAAGARSSACRAFIPIRYLRVSSAGR